MNEIVSPQNNERAPSVSVCMPVFNGAKFLPGAFSSLAAQTFRDFELIVVDDGSTDDTADQAEGLLAAHGLQGRVIRSSANQGCEQARDVACMHARGEIIAHLDCDDTWDKGYLAVVFGILQSHSEVDLVYCDIIQESPDGTRVLKSKVATWIDLSQANRDNDLYVFPAGRFFKLLLNGTVLLPSCTVYRKALYIQAGPYSKVLSDMRMSLDWCFGLRASRHGTIGFVNRPLVHRAVHESNTSGDLVRVMACNVRVLRWVLADPVLSEEERRVALARGAVICTWACDAMLRVRGSRWGAAKWAITSLRFRFNRSAATLLALTLVPRFLVRGVRNAQAMVRTAANRLKRQAPAPVDK